MADQPPEQLSLLAGRRPARRRPVHEITELLPVARVALDVSLPHLDRLFDYSVQERHAKAAQPGTRVKVPFAGQQVDGFVIERVAVSDHRGALSPLSKVVSPTPVLTAEIWRLARAVADHCAGVAADVLRLAIPPRHASVESAAGNPPDREITDGRLRPGDASDPVSDCWQHYPASGAFLNRLRTGDSPRAVWLAPPGPLWSEGLVDAAAATAASGRGAILLVPDTHDLDQLELACRQRLNPESFVRLEADQGVAARYEAFLRILRGQAQIVIGTRAAIYAPVPALGLVAWWQDGDDAYEEPRAPYPPLRDVIRIRAGLDRAAVLCAGWSTSLVAETWLAEGWARALDAELAVHRRLWPRPVLASEANPGGESASARARLPHSAWRAIRDGLERGPVLVQVVRTGYVPALACRDCRAPARCPVCSGPLGLGLGLGLGTGLGAGAGAGAGAGVGGGVGAGAEGPVCRLCGVQQVAWRCSGCQSGRLSARAVGIDRTAEELGRAFPGRRVITAQGGTSRVAVTGAHLVVATPGAEPAAEGGYAAAVLLDGDRLLDLASLGAGEDALFRWRAAAALVRGSGEGGVVVLAANSAHRAVEAFLRGDPRGFARLELQERAELRLPPAVAAATVQGSASAVRALAGVAQWPPGAEVLGPVEVPGPQNRPALAEQQRLVVRIERGRTGELSGALAKAAAVRSARRDGEGTVRIKVNPRDLV